MTPIETALPPNQNDTGEYQLEMKVFILKSEPSPHTH